MIWIIGILAIFLVAYIIVKLTVDVKKNPDSSLGILDHPSTYKKPKMEMVDESIIEDENWEEIDEETVKWNK